MKKLGYGLVALAELLALAFALLRTPDTDRGEMIARYGGEAARFVEDGEGARIHYRDEGPRGAPVLLLVHGSSSSLHTWEAMVRRLRDRYRLVSVDLYGHGLTGPNPARDYSAATQIEAATRVLDAVGVERAVWVGNSMGGWVAWRAVLAEPDRVAGAVLIDASGAEGGEPPRSYLGARLARTTVGRWLLPKITPERLVRSSVEENYADPAKVTDAAVRRYWELLRFPGNRAATLDRQDTNREPEHWRNLGNIAQPVLVLWGEQDRTVPYPNAALFMKALPNATLVSYPDAGHLPMEESPAQVARDIDRWMKSARPFGNQRATPARSSSGPNRPVSHNHHILKSANSDQSG